MTRSVKRGCRLGLLQLASIVRERGGFASSLAAASCGLLLGLTGCGDNQDDAGARQLLARVRSENYRSWQRAPGYEVRRESNAPHGGAVDIYLNAAFVEALDPGALSPPWPLGAVVVKDGFDGAELELIAVMEKRSDGWYWAEYDAEGDPIYSGHPELCIDCHARGSDFIRAFE